MHLELFTNKKHTGEKMRISSKARRISYAIAAFSLATAAVFSGIAEHVAAAQVTSRYIKMGNSNPGATNVAYKVAFTTSTTSNVRGIVVDFCSNDPIIGDACTAPTGFNVNRATTSLNNQTNISGFSVYTSDATNNRIILVNAAGGSVSSGTAVSFELGNGTTNGITNPTGTAGSYYARIYTYATNTAAQSHSTDSPTGYVDYGGIALSTAAVINITAKVMEQLTFCVYKSTCGDDPSFTIGHAVGTATIIDNSAVDTSPTNFSISTNANGGASIRLKGDTLKNGANSIAAAGAAAKTLIAGTENFGVRLSTAGTNITGVAPYNGGSGSQYGLDITSAAGDSTANVTSTFGGQIATLSGPVSNSVSTLTFAATASNTTPAGTYTAAEQLIATGTF